MRGNTGNTVARFVALALMGSSGAALATNGYFTHGVGAESKGMAGTGIGSDGFNGPIIVASNPALGVFADDSWEAGLSFFSPRRSYSASQSQLNGAIVNGVPTFAIGAGSFDSSSEWFPIPYVAKNWKLANDRALTVAFYGRGGMNTDWDNSGASATSLACDPTGQAPVTGPGPFCAGKAGVDLSQAFLAINYAGKTSERFAWGIGPVFAVQMFEANGVASFTPFTKTFAASIVGGNGPVPATNLSNNGHDLSYGWGFAGGLWFALTDAIGVGLSYQSKMSMSEFDDYSDLFAEAGGFDIPSSIKAGVSFKATPTARINFDVEHTMFSEVDSVGNPMANIGGCPTAGFGGTNLEGCLGGNAGAGFGWEDMTTYKVGLEWAANEKDTFRFGYSYGEQPIQPADVQFNILAPGVMEQHITFGWTRVRENGSAMTFSFMYAPEKTVRGPALFDNPFDPSQSQTIELKMDQLEFEFSYRW